MDAAYNTANTELDAVYCTPEEGLVLQAVLK